MFRAAEQSIYKWLITENYCDGLAVVLGVWKDLPLKEYGESILQGEGPREMRSDEPPIGPTLLNQSR